MVSAMMKTEAWRDTVDEVEVGSENPIIYKVLAPSQLVSRITSINSMKGKLFFGAWDEVEVGLSKRELISWESKVPPPKATPPRNKALLRDY